MPVRLILINGFLGSGKTTLLARAGQCLVRRGLRVGLITNDQAEDLVDTEILRDDGFAVQEVSGGCFCCRFEHLVMQADRLIEQRRPDVIIGEAVGSCTDLAATVLQPMRALYGDRFAMAPLSVLADPARLEEMLNGSAEPSLPHSVEYIFAKQLEEAELIVLNKVDLLDGPGLSRIRSGLEARYPGRAVLEMSASRGDGVEEWLDRMLHGQSSGRVVEVDYDVYAEGEAELGWLNALVKLRATAQPADWQAYSRRLLETIAELCRQRSAEIAHVKLMLSAPGTDLYLAGNLTASNGQPSVRGDVPPSLERPTLILNARVAIAPADLRAVLESALAKVSHELPISAELSAVKAIRPSRPTPTYRLGD